jgi:hypothetical protein
MHSTITVVIREDGYAVGFPNANEAAAYVERMKHFGMGEPQEVRLTVPVYESGEDGVEHAIDGGEWAVA